MISLLALLNIIFGCIFAGLYIKDIIKEKRRPKLIDICLITLCFIPGGVFLIWIVGIIAAVLMLIIGGNN